MSVFAKEQIISVGAEVLCICIYLNEFNLVYTILVFKLKNYHNIL